MNALSADITFVATPEELQLAARQGARDIVITEHLDLTGLPLTNITECDGCLAVLGDVHPWTRSIRGDCPAAPPSAVALQLTGSGLAPRRGAQCVLTAPIDIMHVSAGNLWLDTMYLRLRVTGVTSPRPTLVSASAAGRLWMTNVTMQGDGDATCQGLYCGTSKGAFVQGCEFRNLGRELSVVHSTGSPMTFLDTDFVENDVPYEDYATVSGWNDDTVITLENCTFDGNTGPNTFFMYSNATVYASGLRGLQAPVVFVDDETESNVTVPALAQAPQGRLLQAADPWFTAVKEVLLEADLPVPAPAAAPVEVPAPAPAVSPDPILLPPIPDAGSIGSAAREPADSPMPEASFSAPSAATARDATLAPAPAPDTPPSSSDDVYVVIGAAAGVVVLLLLLFAVIAACMCRRSRRREAAAAADAHRDMQSYWGSMHGYNGAHGSAHSALPALGKVDSAASSGQDAKGVYGYRGPAEPHRPLSHAGSLGAADGTVSTSADERGSATGGPSWGAPGRGGTQGTIWTNQCINTTYGMHDDGDVVPMEPPPPGAPVERRVAWVHHQLDSFGPDDVVLGRFRLLGANERRQGGQGVVQFAVGARDGHAYALKFFVIPDSFTAEQALYADSALGPFLPRLEAMADNADGDLVDARGYALPPCIAMEQGESLDEWSRRAKPDLFMAVTVLANVAARLRDMHAAGYAHRDLKPPNVMWLPRENRWTVIDFGCAARIGEAAPLSFTLAYAAPEVVAAMQAGEREIVATGALDVWALGVMALEMLTGATAFAMPFVSKDDVIQQLLGEQPLPWEGAGLSAAQRSRLGVFRRPVMQLLERDPGRRPSLSQFCDMASSIFSATTTVNL